MEKKQRSGTIVLLCCIAFVFAFLYITLVYMRTQTFVHKYLTPPYESEATDFFYDNFDALNRLVVQMDECGDREFYFAFHDHKINTPGIPQNILDTLNTLEESTEEIYAVRISRKSIRITITIKTNFDVFLHYGYPVSENEWDKTTTLDSGWELHAPYTIRS